jgi:hypothetical protein
LQAKAAAVETAAAWDGHRRDAEAARLGWQAEQQQQQQDWQAEQEAAVTAVTRQLADATRTVAALQARAAITERHRETQETRCGGVARGAASSPRSSAGWTVHARTILQRWTKVANRKR